MAEKIFRIPFETAESEFVEKRSRFIGHVWRVDSEEEATTLIKEMKSKYYDARHNCWCYRVGENIARYSDDGEPQGTAGQPMLKVFEREHVTNVCCVVTRYFGGVLLGAGGLTRAYSKSAKDTLIVAGAATMGRWTQAMIPCSYAMLERVKLEITSVGGVIDHISYGADITLEISVLTEKMSGLQMRLAELSAGNIELIEMGSGYRPGPREEVI